MAGNWLQALGGGAFLTLVFGVCVWQLVSTSRAKKRRMAKERAQKPPAAQEGLDGAGI